MSSTSQAFLLILAPLLLAAPMSVADQSSPINEGPSQSDAFVDSIGVDTHFNYNNTPYVQQWPTISAQLIGSGIRHIRDGGKPTKDYLSRLDYLGQHGIRHVAGFDIDTTADRIRSRLQAFAPYVEYVEPANEYDAARSRDPDWVAHLIQEQKLLFTTVHSDSAFSGITVLGPALSSQRLYGELGPLDEYEDAGNLHNATCNQNPGTEHHIGIAAMTASVRESTVSKPIWTTETGYNDNPVRPCAIPDDIIAKYVPRTVAERFNYGEPRIYFYQLADMPADPIFGGQGLLTEEGLPKPQFTALTSLIALLEDPGPPFRVSPVNVSIETSATDVHHTLLQKRSGTYELLLWREAPAWKPISYTNIPSARAATYYTYDGSWHLNPSNVQLGEHAIHVTITDSMSVLQFQ
jgi:hypothetical protein